MIDFWKPIKVKNEFINFCCVNKNITNSLSDRFLIIYFNKNDNKYFFLKLSENFNSNKQNNEKVEIYSKIYDDLFINYYINCKYIFSIDKEIFEKIVDYGNEHKTIKNLDYFCISKILDDLNRKNSNIKILEINLINNIFDININYNNNIYLEILNKYNFIN